MNVIAKISCCLERSVVTLKLRKEYLNTVTYNTSVLLWIKKRNSSIYRTLFCINMYGGYKLWKNSPVFWPTLYSDEGAARRIIMLYRIDTTNEHAMLKRQQTRN